jgi:hypothetical protein
MSIQNHDARDLYERAQAGEGAFANTKIEEIAKASDAAAEGILAAFKEAGLTFPGDDRAENLVTAIFATACEVNL